MEVVSDGGSSDGNDSSSENEQPEVESETGVTEEGTEPELVDCPDGSQAATTEKCPTAPATTELVDCSDGSQAARYFQAACPAVPGVPTLTPSKTFFCSENPTSPECNITPPTSTTTELSSTHKSRWNLSSRISYRRVWWKDRIECSQWFKVHC